MSKSFSIVTASTFVLGVVAWYGAKAWIFDNYRASFLLPIVLAIAFAVSFVRGNKFDRPLMALLSGIGAYASFNLYFYTVSREIDGAAFTLPGIAFSLCLLCLLISLIKK